MGIKGKQTKQPTAEALNAVATLFNQGKLYEAEKHALKITQTYPKHGFGWKVLGAIYQSRNLLDEAFSALKKAAEQLPHDYEAQYNLANYYYDQSQFDDAVSYYKKAVKLYPAFSKAHYNLGNAYKKQENSRQAVVSYSKALSLDVDNLSILVNLAQVLYEQNEISEAQVYYEKALEIQPDFSPAIVGMGVIFRSLNSLKASEQHFRKAIKLDANLEAYKQLGQLLQSTSDFSGAEACFRDAVLAHPDSVDALVSMAIFLRTQGSVPESITYFNQALRIDPSRKDVLVELGLAKIEIGYFSEAESCYRDAIQLDSDFWQAHNNLGLALYKMERYAEAVLALNKAVALEPEEALLHSNLSLPLAAMGQIKKAEMALKKSLAINPTYISAHINLCTNYIAQGRLDEAEAECLEALKYDQNSSMAISNLLFTMNYSEHHSAEYRLQQAREFDRVVSKNVDHAFAKWQSNPSTKRLRIGLMSSDLREHPVAFFLENWVRHVDFSQFELTAYVTDSREDAFTGKLKPNFSYWKSLVGLTDRAAAELIHDDGIDILFDLSGHTAGNRLQIMSWKPAPIQVSWLGYFATTGMKAVDYLIADETGVPRTHQQHFVEKIIYLPDTRLCFTPPNAKVAISSLPALTNGYITFASFQTLAKVGQEVLALWAEVMCALPEARLRWQCRSFGDMDVVADMIARFTTLGVHPDRLSFMASVSRVAYFEAHKEVDVILDSFPYPGGTTTCEALWMGVPTITLAGGSLIARQGASMMTAAGLADLVAETKAEYLNKALMLSNDLNKLAALRLCLREKVLASPLFDGERFAKNMEIALLEMWREHFPEINVGNVTPEALSRITEIKYKLLTREDYEQKTKVNNSSSIVIVSATRYSDSDFWSKSALGLSLHRHLKQYSGMSASILFNNTLGLSDVFNQAIESADDSAILVFVHDDVWIDEANFVDTIIAGLEHFDVIGVAGNKRRLPNQPAWLFVDTSLNLDEPEYLSGTVSHGLYAFGEDKVYGDVPAVCELLDRVFIATTKSALNRAHIRFDNQFDFHLYDVDFCRSAREAGLSLGTWPIKLTHQSKGAFGSPHWAQKCQLYFNKWESDTPQQQALLDAMIEVMQMAQQHKAVGDLVQSAELYQEVLKIQPQNAEANYQLGILLFNMQGVYEALPAFEKAVQANPHVEQYWISYIDALMQAEATETLADALELGQKFGLRKEMAAYLAADYLNKIDSKAEEKLALQNKALQAIGAELKKKTLNFSKSVRKYRENRPIFYIWAPPYTDKSSGIKALHILCDRLNRLGYEAYVTAALVNERLKTPIATRDLIDKHKAESRFQIAIYPEVEMGNPLLIQNVVRYLLNKPNYFLKTSWFGHFHVDEQIIHYADVISIPWIESKAVRIQTIDRGLFNLPDDISLQRKGFLVYSHRAKPMLDQIPEWCKPFEVISMADPKTPEQLAELYKNSAGMIVYERTMAVVEAILCGCPIITCSLCGLDKSTNWYDGYDEFLTCWDFDRESYLNVCKLMQNPGKRYDENLQKDMILLTDTFSNIVLHFQVDELDEVENSPLFEIEMAKKSIEKSDIKSAILHYRQTIKDHPYFLESYYRLGELLIKIGLEYEAIDILKKGEIHLSQLPQSEILNSIRYNYYSKLALAYSAIDNLELKEFYDKEASIYCEHVTTG